MALEMGFWLVDEAAAKAIAANEDYLDGLECFTIGVHHNNYQIFHFLLNGTTDDVGGLNNLFGNSYQPSPAFVPLGNGHAIVYEHVVQLLAEVQAVSAEMLDKRWESVLAGLPVRNQPPALDSDRAYISETFNTLQEFLTMVITERRGLYWMWG
jgi:hypothetical protein